MNQLCTESPEIILEYVLPRLSATDFIAFAMMSKKYYAIAMKYCLQHPEKFGLQNDGLAISRFVNGQKHGVHLMVNAKMKCEKYYRNNQLHGKCTTVHLGANDRVVSAETSEWNMGKLHGETTRNNANNLIVYVYNNGVIHGEAKVFQCVNMQPRYLVSRQIFRNGQVHCTEKRDSRGRLVPKKM